MRPLSAQRGGFACRASKCHESHPPGSRPFASLQNVHPPAQIPLVLPDGMRSRCPLGNMLALHETARALLCLAIYHPLRDSLRSELWSAHPHLSESSGHDLIHSDPDRGELWTAGRVLKQENVDCILARPSIHDGLIPFRFQKCLN